MDLVGEINCLIVANFACQLWHQVPYYSHIISHQQLPLQLANF